MWIFHKLCRKCEKTSFFSSFFFSSPFVKCFQKAKNRHPSMFANGNTHSRLQRATRAQPSGGKLRPGTGASTKSGSFTAYAASDAANQAANIASERAAHRDKAVNISVVTPTSRTASCVMAARKPAVKPSFPRCQAWPFLTSSSC